MNYNSNIYWHFTGSPENVDWQTISMPKDIIYGREPKPTDLAWQILVKILASKKILATAQERLYGVRKTDNFCCVTDIPINHLHKHKAYYGDVAVGFKTKSIHTAFNPVLYIPHDGVIESAIQVIEGYETWSSIDLEAIGTDRETAIRSDFIPNPNEDSFQVPFSRILLNPNTDLEKHLLNYLKITKFSDKPGESFYQEREWRRIGDFYFEYLDIAAIIVPEQLLANVYQKLNEFGITEVSVLSWELIENS
jgi:hypothetical protein